MSVPLLPHSASTFASEVNRLYLGLLVISAAVLLLVFGLMLRFCVRYRAASTAPRGDLVEKSWHWEVSWTAATLVAFLGLFVWGAALFLRIREPPAGATEIYVVAKQWMWKFEHPGGQSEINVLHLPRGQAVRLVMASQDVIHDLFVPAFRVKQDVVPGTYEDLWFRPTETGSFHFFCSQLCGTEHARMRGMVVVMEPEDFARWLEARPPATSLVAQGSSLFRQYGCSGCHEGHGTVRAPRLEGLFGRPVALKGGGFVTADEAYIRDKILRPNAQIPAGYAADMPSFAGKISEEDIFKLIAYVKSLAAAPVPVNSR
jgi:cytochrome c oxidase subunit II